MQDINWSLVDAKSQAYGLANRYPDTLQAMARSHREKGIRLQPIFAEKRSLYTEIGMICRYVTDADIDQIEDVRHMKVKINRLQDIVESIKMELEGRRLGIFVRDKLHSTNYYIDLTNGTDGPGGTVHDGLKEDNGGANYTAIASTDATHIYIAQGALDNDADDNYNGDYLFNVTRSAGALITDYDADDLGGNSVLTHGNIANQVSTDTFYIIRAWKTLKKFAENARGAADIAYVRAATTETMGEDLDFTSDGTQDAYLQIIGCDSVTNDPWGDASNVKPILTFGVAAWQVYFNADMFWRFERLVIKESTDTVGGVRITQAFGNYFKDCDITDCGTTGTYISGGSNPIFDGCTWQDNSTNNLYVTGSRPHLISCIVDAGVGCTNDVIYAVEGSYVECVDTPIGQSNAHNTDDIYTMRGAVVKCRNTAATRAEISMHSSLGLGCAVFEEDALGVAGALFETYMYGTVELDTGVKTGSANFSFKMLPNTNVGPCAMLTLNNNSIIEVPYTHYHAADVEITLTIKIRAVGTWGTYPTAPQLYIETSYLNHAVNPTRATVVSTQVLSHASDWVEFQTVFTPLMAGNSYTVVKFGIFEDAGDGCYCNGEIVAS